MITIIAVYLIFLNVTGFISMYIDKRRAKYHRWRIPEKTLFMIALLGGSLGSRIGMTVFHHKTKHASFVIGIPLIFILQAAGILVYLYIAGLPN